MCYGDFTTYVSPNALYKSFKSNAQRFFGHTESNGHTHHSHQRLKADDSCPTPDRCEVMAHFTKSMFIRIAGISGAVAVAMGAYGTHGFYPKKDVPDELKEVYKTANYYHFLHTLALLGVPLTRRPLLVGTIITAGMTIFCGTCYYYALTGDNSVVKFTPYGGILLIIGWLSMVL